MMSGQAAVEQLKSTGIYWRDRRQLVERVLASSPGSVGAELEGIMVKEFSSSQTLQVVKNMHAIQKASKIDANVHGSFHDGYSGQEYSHSLQLVNRNLKALIKKRVERICVEMKTPMIRNRSSIEQEDLRENRQEIFNNLSEQLNIACEVFPSKVCLKPFLKTCLFDDIDLYDAVKAVKVSNPKPGMNLWSSLSVPLPTESLESLEEKFSQLDVNVKHLGLHEYIADSDNQFYEIHMNQGERVLASNSINDIREFAKRGIPINLRAQFWSKLLQSDFIDTPKSHIQRTSFVLNQKIEKYDLLMDRVLHLDAKHSQNDDSYFVFEEVIRDMLLLWTRDTWITEKLTTEHPTLDFSLRSELFNGIYPIWGVSLYTMPICYLFSEPNEAYMIFREMYIRFFFKLHTLCLNQGSIIHLSALFENLLKQKDAELYYFLSYELDLNPLDIAFKWILYAFVGVLEIDQLLLMWDRVIAYNSLEIIPLTAAALLVYRKQQLLKCSNSEDAMLCFNETGSVKWVPLIISFLKL